MTHDGSTADPNPYAPPGALVQQAPTESPAPEEADEDEGPTTTVDAEGNKIIPLPSGRTAKMRPGNGRDVLQASRLINPKKDPHMRLLFGLIAIKTKFAAPGRDDFKAVTIEDIDALPDFDVFALLGEVQSSGKS